jgi:PKD repeat protein
MKTRLVVLTLLTLNLPLRAATSTILGWNNLGMHCMDSDYSVFSVLPPYNTIEAQLVVNGLLVTNGTGYTVTYQSVPDANNSINTTAIGKGNFYTYVGALYSATPAPDMGLAGWAMPGNSNVPQTMLFEVSNSPAADVATPVNWFRAEGIPISPYDDAGMKNPYPMMRMIAWNTLNQPIATNDVVLPVSDEMDCRACHASGTQSAAQPAAGWVWDGLPERDYRLNILRLHDERQFSQHAAVYSSALAARALNPAGLYRSVTADGKPVLCAACHLSEALPNTGYSNIPPLTASVHSFHAHVLDPDLNVMLDNSSVRAACYRCHPGSTTRCLRGAMGGAVASDGSMEMQCQSCHGTMSQVGSTNRVGWFMEPNCQSCHSGTANSNAGQIRYTSVFTDTNGTVRVPVNQTFATLSNTPAPDLSLYRFSAGHGGLQCEACHGSTHAEFPSTHLNDNLRDLRLQGHAGMMSECTACHTNTPSATAGGPHGLHPIGSSWVGTHPNVVNSGGASQCQPCHGTDFRGTVLSRMQADRTINAFGTKTLFRGAIIGCYTCHNGPGNDSGNTNAPPAVVNVVTNTSNDQAVSFILPATGNSLTLRLISQPANGSVGLNTNTGFATYFPNPGFVGLDTFTFAAYDGSKNSNLGTGAVSVAQGLFSLGATTHVPPSYAAGWPAPFAVIPALTNTSIPATFDWDFGDGTPHGSGQYPAHIYSLPGTYTWKAISSDTVGGVTQAVTNSGAIVIGQPVLLTALNSGPTTTITWPITLADGLLEQSQQLGPSAQWTWVTNTPVSGGCQLSVTLPTADLRFFRVCRPW